MIDTLSIVIDILFVLAGMTLAAILYLLFKDGNEAITASKLESNSKKKALQMLLKKQIILERMYRNLWSLTKSRMI